jgi:hypothetical protein
VGARKRGIRRVTRPYQRFEAVAEDNSPAAYNGTTRIPFSFLLISSRLFSRKLNGTKMFLPYRRSRNENNTIKERSLRISPKKKSFKFQSSWYKQHRRYSNNSLRIRHGDVMMDEYLTGRIF